MSIQVPAEINIVIHEDDARTAPLVLPASLELTDDQLEHTADGNMYDVFVESRE